MLDKQQELQDRIGSDPKTIENFRINMLAIIVELSESLQETAWKPWKKQQETDYKKLKEELVDALHFMLNLFIFAGMNAEDIFNEYMKKNKVNFKRQDEGY
jgi:dimeric dUTPase (all-alpha-NTP-PPase superfamily)